MGSFVYMIARDDADIIEEKRPEFEDKARMTVKRYLSLISNKELRRKVFGF